MSGHREDADIRYAPEVPAEYSGGLDKEGAAALRVFAEFAAVVGSAQPVSGSKVIEEGTSPMPTGLNTCTGPRKRQRRFSARCAKG